MDILNASMNAKIHFWKVPGIISGNYVKEKGVGDGPLANALRAFGKKANVPTKNLKVSSELLDLSIVLNNIIDNR